MSTRRREGGEEGGRGRTWHGRTSLHLVLPAWQAVQALRTEGALAGAEEVRTGTAGHGRGAWRAHARLRLPSAGGAEDPPEPGWGCPPRSEASCWLCCCSCWVSIDGGAPSWAGVEASERADMEVMGGVSDPTVIISRFSSFFPSTCTLSFSGAPGSPGVLRVLPV